MIAEAKIQRSDDIGQGSWPSQARRQGQRDSSNEKPDAALESGGELVLQSLSRPIWPRVFPGI